MGQHIKLPLQLRPTLHKSQHRQRSGSLQGKKGLLHLLQPLLQPFLPQQTAPMLQLHRVRLMRTGLIKVQQRIKSNSRRRQLLVQKQLSSVIAPRAGQLSRVLKPVQVRALPLLELARLGLS